MDLVANISIKRINSLKRKAPLRALLAIALSLFALSSFAATNAEWFPSIGPRLAATGMSGNYTTAEGDLLVPTYGNNNGFFYSDLDAKYGTAGNTYLGSGGVGYRGIHDNRILGAYVFGDASVSRNRNTFWVVNPGVESLGRTWDFRANGYLPVQKEQNVGDEVFAESLGIYSDTTFSGHNQYDAVLQQFESTGYGGDAEVGAKIPRVPARAYVGGYYFGQQDLENIRGVEGRVEYEMTDHLTVLVADTYDNVNKNTIEAGLRFSIDGTSKQDDELTRRLLTPVVRHLANLNNGNGVPISEGTKQVGTAIVQENIYFFTPNGDPSNTAQCTFENPCNGNNFSNWLTTNETTLPGGSNFYFAQGETYPAVDPPPLTPLTIPDTFSVWGRSSDFVQPETVAFSGGFILGNNTALHNVAVYNDPVGDFGEGILISGSDNVLLDRVTVGTPNGAGNGTDYETGVTLENASNVQINDSSINGFSTTAANPDGMVVDFNSNVVANNSTFTSAGKGPIGIFVLHSGVVTLNNSSVSIINTVNQANADGIRLLTGTAVLNGSQISVTDMSSTATATVAGISSQTSSFVTLNNSTINLSILSQNNAALYNDVGIQSINSTLNVFNSVININTNAINSQNISNFGIAASNSTSTVQNTVINYVGNFMSGSNTQDLGIDVNGGTMTMINDRITLMTTTDGSSTSATYGVRGLNGALVNISSSFILTNVTGPGTNDTVAINMSGQSFDGGTTGTPATANISTTFGHASADDGSDTAYGLWDAQSNPATVDGFSGITGTTCSHFVQTSPTSGFCAAPPASAPVFSFPAHSFSFSSEPKTMSLAT